jgi:hypothetical protein
MVDLPTNIVLLGSNMNNIGSMGTDRCSYSCLISIGARIGASVSEMTLLPTSKTPPFSLLHVWSIVDPLNTLIPSSRGPEIVGTLNHRRCGVENPCPVACGFGWNFGEQDGTQVQLKMYQHGTWSYGLTDANAPAYTCAASHLYGSPAQEACSPFLGSSQSPRLPKHRSTHQSSHSRNAPASFH